MSLASLYNVPKAPDEFLVWSFANQDNHVQISDAIYAKRGISIPVYPLDPIPQTDLANWARSHQDVHNAQNVVLGIVGSDLTDVDFNNPGELESWVTLHASEHIQASQILGLGS